MSQLLTEIDGTGTTSDVFVIGATNRPDLLDSALLRPGRFDRLLFLGICADREAQVRVLSALTRKFALAPDVDLRALVAACPPTFTGADFYAVCSSALAISMQRCAGELEAAHTASGVGGSLKAYLSGLGDEALTPRVCQGDLAQALAGVVPSVSPEELLGYERLRAKFCKT